MPPPTSIADTRADPFGQLDQLRVHLRPMRDVDDAAADVRVQHG